MFDIIRDIINHDWISTNAGDQQYIYYICGALIVILTAVIVDLVYRIIGHFWR